MDTWINSVTKCAHAHCHPYWFFSPVFGMQCNPHSSHPRHTETVDRKRASTTVNDGHQESKYKIPSVEIIVGIDSSVGVVIVRHRPHKNPIHKRWNKEICVSADLLEIIFGYELKLKEKVHKNPEFVWKKVCDPFQFQSISLSYRI